MKPSKPITQSTDPTWRYVDAAHTDIRKLFREWQRRNKPVQPVNVCPLRKQS